jgi:hypothetical protein
MTFGRRATRANAEADRAQEVKKLMIKSKQRKAVQGLNDGDDVGAG